MGHCFAYYRWRMNNQYAMDCSSKIRLERQKRSWTQEQLAERAKLSARTVQRIECGADASLETLRLIADAFGIDVDSLRTRTTRTHFSAPWERTVKVVTTVTVVILGIVLVEPMHAIGLIPRLLVLFVLLPSLFLAIAGYSIKDGRLLVHRLGWATKFDLSRLSGFEINPHAMMGSIRLFGNGGLFCYLGLFKNGVLGRYRAYATDTSKCVVLEFGDKKIVVTPDDPKAFVETLREAVQGVCSPNDVKLTSP